ncbi:MAG: protein kinase, partial [Oscillatoriales cyanobacterium SM2_1_8]|nr:protein kinase [Oscillatoriales cyanobacterium SM2_1_8]
MSEKRLRGRYRILKQLGAGGFGKTYLAEDGDMPGHPTCVVKFLKPQTEDPYLLATAQRMFEKEAEVLGKLGSHDRIPRLLAHFQLGGQFFLVQEFIEGESLDRLLLPNQRFPAAEVLTWLKDVLTTLDFVHQAKVIHRDIKPANLIRRAADGGVVVIDFGAVKEITTLVTDASGQSTFTVAIGTPGYMPSEQLGGKPRFCSDIYALGMVAIEALTGTHPAALGEDPETAEIRWHDRLGDNAFPPELQRILDKMVRYDFRQRYQTAREVLQAIANAENRVANPTVPLTPARPHAAGNPTEALPNSPQKTLPKTKGREEALPKITPKPKGREPANPWLYPYPLAMTAGGAAAIAIGAIFWSRPTPAPVVQAPAPVAQAP